MPTVGPPAILFPELDVFLEGGNLVTTKETHKLESGIKSSVFMQHMEMYKQAEITFSDLFGVEADVNFISYLSPDNAFSSFFITCKDFMKNSSGGKSLKLKLLIHSNMENQEKSFRESALQRIIKEKNLREVFPGIVLPNNNIPSNLPIQLEITLPPGIYPIIATENPRNFDKIPKFYLLFASHYDDNFSRMKDNPLNVEKSQSSKTNMVENYHHNIYISPLINASIDGYYSLYGFKSYQIKDAFKRTYDPTTDSFNNELKTKLYESFFEAILELLIIINMADAININQLEFRSFLSDFYVKGTLVTSVKTNERLKEYLENLYKTAGNYIAPKPNPKMSTYIDFFIKGNLIDLSKLKSDSPENVFENSILRDKDSYSRFKNKDKIPKFLVGRNITALFDEYRIEQVESLNKLRRAGYLF
jgi:hypothetical protein